jgi:hypothetical protein
MSVRQAGQIADAVLFEGYLLYPYRASAAKNRFRWQVGLVTPRAFSEAAGSDPWFTHTECLAEIRPGASLTITVRALHVQHRVVEDAVDPERDAWRAVDTLVVDERPLITWDEAVVVELAREALLDRSPRDWRWPWALDAARDVETVHDRSGRLACRVVRRREPVTALVRVATEPCGPFVKIVVRVENLTACAARALGERDAALRQSLAGVHTVLAVEGGAFVSLLDPPADATPHVAACRNAHTWPVLAGDPGSRNVMLSAPIILYDYPAVAPESPGDSFDATEIDELLTWRVRTLTDEEKREARATDDRAARIIDRAEAAEPSDLQRLHGAVRRFGDVIRIGDRVRLQPSHRADTLDFCLGGKLATVTGVYRTLEDKPYIAVALDDDPLASSEPRYRRSLFFHPDELVRLEGGQ